MKPSIAVPAGGIGGAIKPTAGVPPPVVVPPLPPQPCEQTTRKSTKKDNDIPIRNLFLIMVALLFGQKFNPLREGYPSSDTPLNSVRELISAYGPSLKFNCRWLHATKLAARRNQPPHYLSRGLMPGWRMPWFT